MKYLLLVLLFCLPLSAIADSLGTAVQLSGACAGNPYGPCKVYEVSCPSIPALKVDIIVTEPTAPYRGTIVFGIGGSGTAFYRASPQAKSMFNSLKAMGFRLIDRRWHTSWLGGQGGIRAAACRYATLATKMHDLYAQGGAFCGTGNSNGAAELDHSLTHYGRDQIFDMVLPSGGPAIARLDYACFLPTDPAWLSQCPSIIAAQDWQSPDVNGVLGPPLAFEFTPECVISGPQRSICGNNLTAAQLRYESVLSEDAVLNYPYTFVYSLNGTEDFLQTSSVFGLLFNAQITSEKLNVVVDSNHQIFDDPEGVAQMARAFDAYCVKP